MAADDELIKALRAALESAGDSSPLRKHLGDLLLTKRAFQEAEKEYRQALDLAPDNDEIKLTLAEAYYYQGKYDVALVVLEDLMRRKSASPQVYLWAARAYRQVGDHERAAQAYRQAQQLDSAIADEDLDKPVEPQAGTAPEDEPAEPVLVPADDVEAPPAMQLEKPRLSFKDVGGMEPLKEEIRLKIIYPLSHPEIYQAYGKTIGGGILMYGPPGCGKTYLARATAGEVNAHFLVVGIHDVLNMYLGQSENNLHEIFELARANTPCVLFFDEVDALGASRSDMRQSAGRQVINQFLSELDGVNSSNEGVLILAATNAPWHLDSALRRPGRFDRVLFVPPPDQAARTAILQLLLAGKPCGPVDFKKLARETEGFSGADLKGVVEAAVEQKIREAMKQGALAQISTSELMAIAKSVKPTTREWFSTARNYALYSNQSGLYDEILEYLNLSNGPGLFSKNLFSR